MVKKRLKVMDFWNQKKRGREINGAVHGQETEEESCRWVTEAGKDLTGNLKETCWGLISIALNKSPGTGIPGFDYCH